MQIVMNAFEKIKDRGQYEDDTATVGDESQPADSSGAPEATESSVSEEQTTDSLVPEQSGEPLSAELRAEQARAYEAQPDVPANLSEQWLHMLAADAQVMFEFALKNSKPIDPDLHARMHSGKVSDLINVYRNLSDVIRPATAASIIYIQSASNKRHFISPFAIVNDLVILGLLSIAVFIGVSVSPYVNEDDLSKGVLHNSGFELLHSLLFICATSCLGAIFSTSIQVVKKLSTYTLTLNDTHYFKSLLVIGMMSGLIMSEFLGIDSTPQAGVISSKMMMALLGGTASEVLYIILNMLMTKIRNMIAQI